MNFYKRCVIYSIATLLLNFSCPHASEKPLPKEMQEVIDQDKYAHSLWGIYVKDIQTGEVLYDIHSEKLFSPASTTKLFTIAALLHTFGDNYRFKTPVFASGQIEKGQLQGNLILVAQGDLTMGGRELKNLDKISYTKMDHVTANEVPGVILTSEDPLNGLNELAKQVYQSGIREVHGDVIIDDSLFETVEKRGMMITPLMINENLIDLVINPTTVGNLAKVVWRPQVPGYIIDNQIKTVAKEGILAINISSDDTGHKILAKGTIPLGQSDIVRTFSIKDPKAFARAAFIQALQKQNVKMNIFHEKSTSISPLNSYHDIPQVALWTSPPLSEYAKLVLKVSHNLGANLVPLLLASHEGKKTFVEGMKLLGDFAIQEVKLSPNSFVFIDGAGGNENRLTAQAEIQLLEYMHKQPPLQFHHFFDALPILGVDGSLADFGKGTQAVGKVRAKPGSGVAYNLATNKYFLITQAFTGYIEGKNGHLLAYMVVVNNATMPTLNDIFPMFEDESLLSTIIYNLSDSSK
jgi:serine-type D-Ala-D-Ala carboxypeptidase/endopeptidase (penicillin-binding protein 4)